MSVAAWADVTHDPTLGNFFTGSQSGYDLSSGVVGRSVENNGWTATITDCVGDDYLGFFGVEITAPEGTVLDGTNYEIEVDNEYDKNYGGSSMGFAYALPDDDPTDNVIRLVYHWYTTNGVTNHLNMRLMLHDLVENYGYLKEEHKWDRQLVQGGEWDFGWIPIDYEDNAIRLAPMLEVQDTGLEENLVLSEIVISPVGLYIAFDGPEPYHIDWLADWYEPNVGDTVQLWDVDGNEIPFGQKFFYGPSGTYFSFTNTSNAMNNSNSEGLAELNLIDLEQVGALTVAGFTIPVQ